MKRFAITIALTLILVGSAYAQGRPNPTDTPDLWSGPMFSEKMNGLETAKGTEDYEDDIIWGRSITLAGASGEFTAYINRGGVKTDTDSGNKIVGGTWTLHLYKEGQLRGMLFGEFTGGTIEWMKDKEGNVITEIVTGNLVVTGGTGEFEAVDGPLTSGVMWSASDVNPKGFPLHNGVVKLIF
jgi:hypothetical protein